MKSVCSRSLILCVLALGVASPALARQAPVGPAPATQTPRPSAVAGRAHVDSDDEKSAPQAFSVVLVLGEMSVAGVQDNVPAAARKALADMKDFLPYKSYRLLDTQWTLCCGREALTSRLKGAEDQEYQLQLSASMVGAGRVNVRFTLSEPGLAEMGQRGSAGFNSGRPSARIGELERQIAALQAQYESNENRSGQSAEQAKLKSQISSLQSELLVLRKSAGNYSYSAASRDAGMKRAVIDTSFRMDVGETVVVGTSRTKGDKALIALLTAVPPKAATSVR